jgi:hypothetical protein
VLRIGDYAAFPALGCSRRIENVRADAARFYRASA